MDIDNTKIWNQEAGWSLDKEILLASMKYFPLAEDPVYQSWCVSPIHSGDTGTLALYHGR
ncbi:hypothetical protein [Psychromonas sp. MB-3u-54]|uniref:hypothetical protein n=1 Tax=Psychromonas sp. MB-3u-54 TaxID=2058319 RepID=UPI0012FEC0EA|nr:hypothetical protein [Psychromonas sp. MB-3u-54]